jgi:hypothetical protein
MYLTGVKQIKKPAPVQQHRNGLQPQTLLAKGITPMKSIPLDDAHKLRVEQKIEPADKGARRMKQMTFCGTSCSHSLPPASRPKNQITFPQWQLSEGNPLYRVGVCLCVPYADRSRTYQPATSSPTSSGIRREPSNCWKPSRRSSALRAHQSFSLNKLA